MTIMTGMPQTATTGSTHCKPWCVSHDTSYDACTGAEQLITSDVRVQLLEFDGDVQVLVGDDVITLAEARALIVALTDAVAQTASR